MKVEVEEDVCYSKTYCKWFEEKCNSKELLKERESEAITHDDFGNSIEPIYDCKLDCNECQYVQYEYLKK